jgi:hypothetical protein
MNRFIDQEMMELLMYYDNRHMHKDDIYECVEQEQYMMMEWLLSMESFYQQAKAEHAELEPIARTRWNDNDPIRQAYNARMIEMIDMTSEITSLLRDIPRYQKMVCPVTMPWIHGILIKIQEETTCQQNQEKY